MNNWYSHSLTTIIIAIYQISPLGSLIWALLHAPSHFAIFSLCFSFIFPSYGHEKFLKILDIFD